MSDLMSDLTYEQLAEENAVLRQSLIVVAASFPTKLILGKTEEKLSGVIEAVREGRFVRPIRF